VGRAIHVYLMEPETEDGNDRVEAKVDEEHIVVPLPAILWGPRTWETQKEVRGDMSQTVPGTARGLWQLIKLAAYVFDEHHHGLQANSAEDEG
jgi:hypothetical protein